MTRINIMRISDRLIDRYRSTFDQLPQNRPCSAVTRKFAAAIFTLRHITLLIPGASLKRTAGRTVDGMISVPFWLKSVISESSRKMAVRRQPDSHEGSRFLLPLEHQSNTESDIPRFLINQRGTVSRVLRITIASQGRQCPVLKLG